MPGKGSARRELWEKFHSEVSLAGFKYLFTEKGWKKLFWVVGFFAALAFSVYLNYDTIAHFVEYDVLNNYNKEEMDEYPFPTLTFCPLNSVLQSKIKDIGLTEKSRNALQLLFGNNEFEVSSQTITNFHKELHQLNISDMESLSKRIQINVADLFDGAARINDPTCMFYGRKCNSSDFKITWMVQMSQCFQFNGYVEGKESLKVKTAGALGDSFGLTCDLHVDDIGLQQFNGEGVFVMLHPYGTPAYLMGYGHSFFASSGMNVMSRMHLKERELLPAPYATHCGDVELKVLRGYPYSQRLCEADCLVSKVYEKCGCVTFKLKHNTDLPICNITAEFCFQVESRRLHKYIDCSCPIQCQVSTFGEIIQKETRLTYSHLKVENLRGSIQTFVNMSDEQAKKYLNKNLMSFWMYFHDFIMLKEEEEATVSVSELIGNIGGNIGLCVGFSILTIFEFLEFLWDFITIREPDSRKKLPVNMQRRYSC